MAHTEKIFFLPQDIQSSGGHTFMKNQRASKRLNHEAPLIIENCASGTYSCGRMYNYSRGGFYFESDTPFQAGTRIRIDIEKAKMGLDAGQYFAEVKWCAEISAAVVLYDFGIGAEFDPKINAERVNGKLMVIKGGAKQNKA